MMTENFKPKNPLWIIDCFGRILDYDLRRGLPLRRHLVLGDYPSLYLDGDTLSEGDKKTNQFCYIHQAEKKLPDFYVIKEQKGTVALKSAENNCFLSMNPASWYPLWLVDSINDWERVLLADTQTFHAFGLLDEGAAAKIYNKAGNEIFFDLPDARIPLYRNLGKCHFNVLDNLPTIKALGAVKPNETKKFSLKDCEGENYDFTLERNAFEIPEFDGKFNPYF